MNRLTENVFQFKLSSGSSSNELTIYLIGIGVGFVTLGLGWWLLYVYHKNFKTNGLIFDRDRKVVSICKWTWTGEQQFHTLQFAEIKGISTDVNYSTETRYNQSSDSIDTTTNYAYNLIFQGDFGSKRVKFSNVDDWRLLQTLLTEKLDLR